MKILILSNIPTPYRCSFFSTLNKLCKNEEIELLVLFANKIEKNRNWDYKTFNYSFNYKILDGFSISLFHYEFHINYKFSKIINNFNPSHTIIAGSWNMPIVILLELFKRKTLGKTYFWNETQKYSVHNTSFLIDKFRRLIYNKFDNFLVPNNLSKDFVLNYISNKNIYFLPNTINQQIFKKHYNVDYSKKIQIVQVSQLEKRKCVIELIQNFKSLPFNIKENFELTIIGDGPLKEDVQNLITDCNNIFLIDYITQVDLALLYKKIDFFVLSSTKDPNPLSPIEAIFSGKLVFLSLYLGNARDLIPDYLKDEFLFNPLTDFSHIFYKMIEIHKSQKQYQLFLDPIYKKVTSTWDENIVCNNLINDLKK